MKSAAIPATDLSGLENFRLSEVGEVHTALNGTPIEIPLGEIEEDPENARKEYDPETMRELANSIRADKVREPISVRSKNEAGKYRVNSGSRRYRASKMAGKATIPAFIDDTADEDARFVVNVQRDALTPMDVAGYLHKRLPAFNNNKSQLAERIGMSSAYITQHLSLLQLPPVLRELYDKGVTRSATVLYELARLHRKNAAAVESAVEGATEISGALLKQLAAAINAKADPENEDEDEEESEGSSKSSKAKAKKARAGAGAASQVRILVMHKGKRYELAGEFLTTLKPSAPGRIYVRKGSEKPIQVTVKDLELDSILVK